MTITIIDQLHTTHRTVIEISGAAEDRETEPSRTVILTIDEIDGAPATLEGKGYTIKPAIVTIDYRPNSDSDGEIALNEVTVNGPSILKGGGPGARRWVRFWRLRDGLNEGQLEILGDMVVPQWLEGAVKKFNPVTGGYRFTAGE